MAYGPIFPYSAIPVTTKVFPYVFVGSGSGSRYEEMLGIADLSAAGTDEVWALRFRMPPALPGDGSPYLHLQCLSVASTGVIKLNPKWICAGSFHDPSSFTLGAEGTETLTWTNAIGRYIEAKIGLDVSSLFANGTLVMNLVSEYTGWTVDRPVGMVPTIIWE